MNQFFIEPASIYDGKVIITKPADVKHIEGVLRLKAGEDIQAVNISDGITYFCTIENMDKNAVTCLIQDIQSESTELPVNIILYQGLPKGDKLEFVIQKAVELGAARIVPVAMKRSVMKIDPKKADSKCARWNMIAESAASQSKRGLIPEVSPVISFKAALDEASRCASIILPYELAKGMDDTRQIMEEIRKSCLRSSDSDERPSLAVFIGPEGGFEPAEVEAAIEAGAKIITLGRRILRTETAPLAILSWLTYLLDT